MREENIIVCLKIHKVTQSNAYDSKTNMNMNNYNNYNKITKQD